MLQNVSGAGTVTPEQHVCWAEARSWSWSWSTFLLTPLCCSGLYVGLQSKEKRNNSLIVNV